MNPKDLKILVVVESIDVEDSSGSKANLALINNLQAAGYTLSVYHFTKKDIHLEGISTNRIKENRRSILFFLSRAERYLRVLFKIHLHRPLENVFGFSFTLFNDRNSIIRSLKQAKNLDLDPDIILTLSKGGSFRPHHALLKLPEWHSKWLAYIHDPYPMHLYPRPYTWVEPGHMKKYLFVKEIFQKAASLAFPSQLLMEWMESYFPESTIKGVIVPHQISKIEKVGFPSSDFFDPEMFNIVHAGNLLWGRDPKGLIDGFKKFLNRNPSASKEAKLIFLGGANHYSALLLKSQNDTEQMYFSNRSIPFAEVQAIQNSASVNVILEAKSEISPFLPGKFPHCISAAKPILLLGPRYSESRRLLGEDYPYWAEIYQIELIADILEQLYIEWREDGKKVSLKRPDLVDYLSEDHLKQQIDYIKNEFIK